MKSSDNTNPTLGEILDQFPEDDNNGPILLKEINKLLKQLHDEIDELPVPKGLLKVIANVQKEVDNNDYY